MSTVSLKAFANPRDIVLVEGADARSYLQTQLTQDIESIFVGSSLWSFILNPKSSIDALVRVTRIGQDRVTLDVEPGFGDAVRGRLDGHLFRTDARFSQYLWPGVSWRGEGATSMAADAPIVAVSPWPGVEGRDVVGPNVVMTSDAIVGTADEFDMMRISSGWPRMGSEIGDGITPAMTGLVDLTVSFEKGCYTGQELVARTHHRGAAPTKRLVSITSPGSMSPGAAIVVGDEEVGSVTSSTGEGLGLGYLARKVDTPSDGSVDGVSVKLEALTGVAQPSS
jgi:tRNA-modifying protein YgfZ